MQKELISQWRNFIKNKYKTYEEINTFYNGGMKIDKNINIVENNTITFQKDNANYTFDKYNNIISYNITSMPTTDWGNQIHYGTINITNSTYYTVEFDARARNPTNGTLAFRFQENQPPYRYYLEITKIELKTYFAH